METSSLTAREWYAQVKASPKRKAFGFGSRAVLVNIDLQNAYTRVDRYASAYETDPKQLEYVNKLSGLSRLAGCPVVFTYVAYVESGEDAGLWGTRTNTEDSLQNIKHGSDRAELDERLNIVKGRDIILHKRMPSPFFETSLPSLLVFHGIDTVILTGGSTSGCIRAAAVDSLSRGYRTIVVEECVADKHEIPHFAALADLHLKYADVVSVAEASAYLESQARR